MSDLEKNAAWLESADGTRTIVQASCSIGRLPTNQIVLPEERVSRRHALVNAQEDGDFWLVDLGSGNGTYLNSRRLVQPTLLRDGDRIEIGSFALIFRQPSKSSATPKPGSLGGEEEKTIQHIKSSNCWLLVADIASSTQLIKNLPESELPQVTGGWLARCRELIERHGGSLNKFLGDGFFAYWPHTPQAPAQIAAALRAFSRLQDDSNPAFRVVLHYGQVFMGGAASMGEESLLGKEVHFAFRMEKLASGIGERMLISDPARRELPADFETMDAGRHKVQSFDGEFTFHSHPKRMG
jgi:adenylate cyclase